MPFSSLSRFRILAVLIEFSRIEQAANIKKNKYANLSAHSDHAVVHERLIFNFGLYFVQTTNTSGIASSISGVVGVCSAQLIYFEIDCFSGLGTRIYEYAQH